jgi:hypothetical protein
MRDTLSMAVAIVIGLTACQGEQPPPSADPATPSESSSPARHVVLDGQPNSRNLGGYATSNGRHVKWGQIYWSGELLVLENFGQPLLFPASGDWSSRSQ